MRRDLQNPEKVEKGNGTGAMKQITSFSIDWHHRGLCSSLDKVRERTTVYLRRNLIKSEKFNGSGELLGKEECFVCRESISKFFDFISKTDSNNEWKKDYTVAVCDGSRWEMRLRYSDRTVRLIVGTAKKPDKGIKIEEMIKDMLSDGTCIEMPVLFGC